MYSPSLQYSLVQVHIQELHRARQTRSAQPITTKDRTATRRRNAVTLSAYLSRAIERFVGHVTPEAPAFEGRP
jgi:hypothetical protein